MNCDGSISSFSNDLIRNLTFRQNLTSGTALLLKSINALVKQDENGVII